MSSRREFDLGDVLSVTTGRLLSPRRMDGIYDVLDYMTGDNLYTHQLPRAQDVCRPAVLAQHPELASVVVPAGFDTPELELWLDETRIRYGETRVVVPVAEWQHLNPIEELCDLVGTERVWVYPLAASLDSQETE